MNDPARQHPRGNYWFAADWPDDEEKGWPEGEEFCWRVWIQLPGMVDCLSTRFESESDAEDFIREDIIGAAAELGPRTVVPGEVIPSRSALTAGDAPSA
jgi:hypothetical protein